ncbi:MAG TPA: S-layer homology domain-containing protein [Chloroflexia bacterium]|nr:S-layer homology domain-containing protein [Chloroflexia bacterium]
MATDVPPDNTFNPFVLCLACRGIISGYACGEAGEPCGSGNLPYFWPNDNVTRGQVAKVVAMGAALPTPTPGQQTFQDVATNSTFWQWIEELSTAGAISGYKCGGAGEPCNVGNKPYFRPYDYLA